MFGFANVLAASSTSKYIDKNNNQSKYLIKYKNIVKTNLDIFALNIPLSLKSI